MGWRDLKAWKIGVIVGGFLCLVLIYGYITSPYTTYPPPTYPPPPEFTVYGKLTDFYPDNDLIVFEIQSEVVNWELNRTDLEVRVSLTPCEDRYYQKYIKNPEAFSKLIKGNNYYIHAAKSCYNSDYPNLISISENPTETYKMKEKYHHRWDLEVGPSRIYNAPPGTPRNTTPIIAGELNELEVPLTNIQDNDIDYKIVAAQLVNEEALIPWGFYDWQLSPIEERAQNATIDECEVIFDALESTITANTTKNLTFIVNCPKGVNTTKNYVACDVYAGSKNCSIRTADGTALMLWGEMEFVDELGNTQVIGGYLKQLLELK